MKLLRQLSLWLDHVNVAEASARAWRQSYSDLRDAVIPESGVVGSWVIERATYHREQLRHLSRTLNAAEKLARAIEDSDDGPEDLAPAIHEALREFRAGNPRQP